MTPTRWLAFALIVTLLGGCIEFEKQTLLVRRDAEKDEVHIRLIYEGIWAGGDDLAKDMAELRKVADRGTRFFLFDNWPLVVDVGRPEEGEKDEPANALLRPFVTVTNGTFFKNADGKLSAWQDVRVVKASKVLLAMNRLVNLSIMTGKLDGLDDADAETLEICRNLAMAGHEWFRIDEKGIHCEFGVSKADAVKLKRAFLEELVESAVEAAGKREKEGEEKPAGLDEAAAVIRILARNPFSWVHEGNRVRITLAADEHGVIRGETWNEGEYVPNLLEPAEGRETPPKLPAPIDAEMTVEKLVEGFVPE
jgi:hypothetical protein